MDFDLIASSSLTQFDHFYELCPEVDLGGWGFDHTLPFPGDSPEARAAFIEVAESPMAHVGQVCACEYSGEVALCPTTNESAPFQVSKMDFRNMVAIYGASWWVQLFRGGKDLGLLEENFKLHTEYWAYWSWQFDTLAGFRRMDVSGDGQLQLKEFKQHLLKPEVRINPEWVQMTLQRRPCMLADAAVHLNHSYVWLLRLETVHAGCGLPSVFGFPRFFFFAHELELFVLAVLVCSVAAPFAVLRLFAKLNLRDKARLPGAKPRQRARDLPPLLARLAPLCGKANKKQAATVFWLLTAAFVWWLEFGRGCEDEEGKAVALGEAWKKNPMLLPGGARAVSRNTPLQLEFNQNHEACRGFWNDGI